MEHRNVFRNLLQRLRCYKNISVVQYSRDRIDVIDASFIHVLRGTVACGWGIILGCIIWQHGPSAWQQWTPPEQLALLQYTHESWQDLTRSRGQWPLGQDQGGAQPEHRQTHGERYTYMVTVRWISYRRGSGIGQDLLNFLKMVWFGITYSWQYYTQISNSWNLKILKIWNLKITYIYRFQTFKESLLIQNERGFVWTFQPLLNSPHNYLIIIKYYGPNIN